MFSSPYHFCVKNTRVDYISQSTLQLDVGNKWIPEKKRWQVAMQKTDLANILQDTLYFALVQ